MGFLDDLVQIPSNRKQTNDDIFGDYFNNWNQHIKDRNDSAIQTTDESARRKDSLAIDNIQAQQPPDQPSSGGFSFLNDILKPAEQKVLRFSNSVNQGLFGINPLQDQATYNDGKVDPKFLEAATPAQNTSDKITEGLGYLTGMALPYNKAYEATAPLFNLLSKGVTNKYAQDAIRGGLAGLGYSTGEAVRNETAGLDNKDLTQRLEDIGLNTALGAAGDPLFRVAGNGISKLLERLRKPADAPLEASQNAIPEKPIQPETQQQPLNVQFGAMDTPQARFGVDTSGLTGELPPLNTGLLVDRSKINFGTMDTPQARWKLNESTDMPKLNGEINVDNSPLFPYRQEFNQAVSDQYNLLKNDLNNLGGVEQGKVFHDDNGDVIGRQGRTSNNPLWYQDFYKQNGRRPTNQDLQQLAKEQMMNGYRTESGVSSSFRPKDAHELDSSIKEIQNMLQTEKDPSTQQALRQTLNELNNEYKNIVDASNLEIGKKPKQELIPQLKQPKPKVEPKIQNTIDQLMSDLKAGNMKPKAQGPNIFHELSVPQNVQRAPKNILDALPQNQQQQPEPGVKGFFGRVRRLTGSGSQDTIARNQVVQNIRNNLGVVIDTGRLNAPGAQGVYRVAPEVIRTARAEDLETIAHEIGHDLEKHHQLVSNDPTIDAELRQLAHPLTHNNPAYGPNDIPEEGLAEFFRHYLTNPQQAQQMAPNLYEHIMNRLPQNVRNGLENTVRDVQTWINQGDYNQARGLIDFQGVGDRRRSVRESFNQLYREFMDDLHPLRVIENAIRGSVQIGSQSLYKLARNSRGAAEKAAMAIDRGIYDNQGNRIGESLRDISRDAEQVLHNLNSDWHDFTTYLVAKHTEDLRNLGRQTTLDDAHIQAVFNRLDTPEMQALQQRVVGYNNHLMDILTENQIISHQAAAEMRRMYPNYVPFMRFFDDDALGFTQGGLGSARGFANLTNPVRRMSEEGSTRTIINPLESMVKNTFLVMNAASKNRVGLELANLSQIDGAGHWVEQLVEGGRNPREHIVAVFENGAPTQYKIRDDELYQAMLSLDHEASNFAIRTLGAAASALRAGATLTPEFIIRNPMRDVLGSFINVGFNPISFFRGLGHVISRDNTFDQFISSGGAYSTLAGLDRNSLRESLDHVFRDSMRERMMNVVTNPRQLASILSGWSLVRGTVRTLGRLSETTELATKVGHFDRVLRRTGDLDEAAFQARDLMDFNRAGSSVRQINRIVAFFNASLQGTDKMVRSFREQPGRFLTRMVTGLVLPTAGLWYLNNFTLSPEKKKLYDNIPQWQKDSFFIIPGPGNEFVRIPKPFEAGMLFATSTERILDHALTQKPEAFKGYMGSVLSTLTPPVVLTSVMPLIEAMTNYNFFQGRNIVPQSQQNLQKKDQYDPLNTSQTAKLLGQWLSMTPFKDTNLASPRIIDNTIKGYTAGLGQYGLDLADTGINAAGAMKEIPKPAKKLTEEPFLRSFFVNTSGGGQVRSDFYDQYNKLEQVYNSSKQNRDELKDPEVKDEIRQYRKLDNFKNMMDDLQKKYKKIQSDPVMSPNDKRSKLDTLDSKMNDIAAKGLGKGK